MKTLLVIRSSAKDSQTDGRKLLGAVQGLFWVLDVFDNIACPFVFSECPQSWTAIYFSILVKSDYVKRVPQ